MIVGLIIVPLSNVYCIFAEDSCNVKTVHMSVLVLVLVVQQVAQCIYGSKHHILGNMVESGLDEPGALGELSWPHPQTIIKLSECDP